MPNRRRPRTIPKDAIARSIEGQPSSLDYFLGDRRIARVHYHSTGAIAWEQRFDDQGRLHGVERYEFEDGRTQWRARWVHGLQHGLQEQWDDQGSLICQTRFVRGTGVDLWFDHKGNLAEQRTFVDGKRHGVERWWHGKNTIWHEIHFWQGLTHGIERQWNNKGRLRRGYPRYFVKEQKVPRRAYEEARLNDPSLPPIEPKDNRPRRKPPEVGPHDPCGG